MSDKLLVLRMARIENILIGRVVHQDESLREYRVDGTRVLYKSDRFSICCISSNNLPSSSSQSKFKPQLIPTTLFVGGCMRDDDRWFGYCADSKEEAVSLLKEIRRGVAQINREKVKVETEEEVVFETIS